MPRATKCGILEARLAVAQRRPCRVADAAAGRGQHGVAGRGVPFHRASETRVQVGRPSASRPNLSDEPAAMTDASTLALQARAGTPARAAVVAMGAAARPRPALRPARLRQRRSRRRPCASVLAPRRPARAGRRRAGPAHRQVDHPQHRFAPSCTSAMLTVNSPLRATNSRVPSSGSTSQKVRADGRALAARGRLLRPPPASAAFSAQARHDDRLGLFVGRAVTGDCVGLALHIEVAAVDVQYHRPGRGAPAPPPGPAGPPGRFRDPCRNWEHSSWGVGQQPSASLVKTSRVVRPAIHCKFMRRPQDSHMDVHALSTPNRIESNGPAAADPPPPSACPPNRCCLQP